MNSNHRKQLQEKLWASAQQLRANGSLKLNEISEPILGLIFLKFADVRFKRVKKNIVAEQSATYSVRSRPVTPDHYKAQGVLYIPERSTYSYLMNLSEGENLGKAINEAMKTIEEQNRELAGILPQNYTAIAKSADENNRILITLLKNFNQIPDDIEGDAFGEIYEYFLGEFARAEGQKGGEFFTPQPIVKLLVEILEPYHGKIYDPACGSGGMFVHSARFVQEHMTGGKNVMAGVGIYGQEKGESNLRVAKMNLAIHGLSGKIELANSFYEDMHDSLGKFDFVLANPPFNVKGKDKNQQMIIDPARLHGDKRYVYGLPLTGKNEISNANYLWMQMFASALSPKGRAGFVMANSASDAGNAEKEIRKKMVEQGFVDVVISVGTNMFLNATLSCTLWFFDKSKINTPRQNQILLINAQDIFTVIDRAHNTWTDEQIQEIASIVRRYRQEEDAGKYEDTKGRCKVVTLDDVRANDYSLNPGRYIEIIENEMDDVNFDARMHELMAEFTSLTSEAHQLERKIIDDWKKIL
ncbi:MAG: class I SAM-dependent DNA methyltransferase [Gammaproteobacteria bacterium]|nr:class I SAM-dependent DNA methyltransferase [Gammaproteobacteria bacterium]